MKPAAFALAAALLLGLSSACPADDLTADQRFTETGVAFELKGPYSNVTLTVSGPNDFHASAFSRSGAPAIDLRRFGAVEDGTYAYQLTAAGNEKVKIRTPLDDGRDSRTASEPRKGVSTSGAFHVRNGTIVKSDPNAREEQRRQK
jgi:hypothetical protein